jgi:subtilisin family serine protease
MPSSPLDLVQLAGVMELSAGEPDVAVGLVDGPVVDHQALQVTSIRRLYDRSTGASGPAAAHGTFVAGILTARRGTEAPGICPGCTLLVRPVLHDAGQVGAVGGILPLTTPELLAEAIVELVDAGARVLNLSVAIAQPSTRLEPAVDRALRQAARRGCVVVAAAGNQTTLGSTAITRHQWVIPVAAFDLHGRPLPETNLGVSVGGRGLGAPGERILSLAPKGGTVVGGGTSAATPFVTGTVALLLSLHPSATASEIKAALAVSHRRRSIVPALLDAWGAHTVLGARKERKGIAYGVR